MSYVTVIVPSVLGVIFSASMVAASRTSRCPLGSQWLDCNDVASTERHEKQFDRRECGVVAARTERNLRAAIVTPHEAVLGPLDHHVICHSAIMPRSTSHESRAQPRRDEAGDCPHPVGTPRRARLGYA